MKVRILGRGKVGRGLASGLPTRDVELRSARTTRAFAPGPDVFLLAVADGAISDVSSQLARRVTSGTVVLHCAGARTAEELDACADAGAETGVFHPLISFPSLRRSPSVVDGAILIDGTTAAIRAATRLARAMKARPVVSPVHGPAYHASAALAANGTAALADAAIRILADLGLSPAEARHAVASLLRTVAENVEHVGLPEALTGPIARGDAGTVSRHIEALESLSPRLAETYRAIGPAVLDTAARAGLPPARRHAVRKALAPRPSHR